MKSKWYSAALKKIACSDKLDSFNDHICNNGYSKIDQIVLKL